MRPATQEARAAAIEAACKRATAAVPDGVARSLSRMRGQIAEWVLAEVAPGRLLPWLPVAFGAGIALTAPGRRSDAPPQLDSFEPGN